MPAGSEEKELPPDRAVREWGWWRRVLLFPLAVLLRLWCGTLRFQVGDADRETMRATPSPVVFLLWHNRLFVAGEVRRRFRPDYPLAALISASRDGAWLAALFRLIGIGSVRGSRNFRGDQALRELARASKEGIDVAITPDGSRGPVYVMKPGALLSARLAGAVILSSCAFEDAWQLRSWDRLYIPKPFSKVRLRCERVDMVALKKAYPIREDQIRFLEEKLNELGDL